MLILLLAGIPAVALLQTETEDMEDSPLFNASTSKVKGTEIDQQNDYIGKNNETISVPVKNTEGTSQTVGLPIERTTEYTCSSHTCQWCGGC